MVHGSYQGQRKKNNTMTRRYRYCLHKQFEKREIESSIPEPEDEF